MSDNNAAAPKAEPVSDPYKLEAVKHLITTRLTLHDADVTLGGVDRVAADIVAMLVPLPEAPKVEQGLVGYLEGAAIADLRNGFASVTATVYSKAESGCEAIYTHPAPASDELLEAAIETVAKFDAASNTPVKDTPLGINRLRGAIAKHKGPQS